MLRLKTTLIFMLLFSITFAQDKERVSISFKDKTIEDALTILDNKFSGINFAYNNNLNDLHKEINITYKSKSFSYILQDLLSNTSLTYKQVGNTIVILKNNNKTKPIYKTISGYISDKKTGETLIGATVYCKELNKGTVSNAFGFYSIRLPKGYNLLTFSFIGYADNKIRIDVKEDIRLKVELSEKINTINEVVVRAELRNNNIVDVAMNTHKMNISTIKKMPALLGEIDVMKSLQSLPGIQSSGDASANINVRGGSYDQNLILLDDAPIYNPTHALGFFSVFNPDAIKDVKVYKGGMPAQYGDRLSSVVDIRMNDGNMKKIKGSASVGTIASRFSLEGPLKKDKASFILSSRYSYAGMVADGAIEAIKAIGLSSDLTKSYRTGNNIRFYDLNLKMNYKVNDNNRLFLSAYGGRDDFHYKLIDEKSSMDWGNKSATLRWNHIFNSRLFMNTTMVYSNFDYAYYIKDDVRDFKWSSDLKEIALKSDLDFFLNSKNKLKFGLSMNYHNIQPGKIEPRSENSITKPFEIQKNKALETSAYISHEFDITPRLRLQYGVRYSSFANIGKGTVYTYKSDRREEIVSSKEYKDNEFQSFFQGIEPRANLRFSINKNQSVKMSYAKTRQYLHLLSASNLGMPTDVWYPVNKNIKPQEANQLSAGYFRNFLNNKWALSIETYYKSMSNQIDFKDNANLFLNSRVEQEILSGKGWSYGVELMIKKQVGLFNGWLSYTWSKTEKQIDGINNNNPYPARYDKRHNLSLVMNYKINERMQLSSNFVFSTGAAVTVPKGSFEYQGTIVNYYTERNAYRLPDYNRLDLSFTYKNKPKKKYNSEWIFALYNVYNRHNAFSIYTKQDEYDQRANKSYKIYMFGLVPSITYHINF